MSTRRNVEPVIDDDDLGAPLTARSVLASTLLGTDPPELPVAQLVAVAALFGISENRARVALSRMVQAGEAVAVDGRYRLIGSLAARGRRQRESRRSTTGLGGTGTWRGDWTMVVLDGDARGAKERAAHRRDLRRARLGELREGVWLRPANVAVDLGDELAGRVHRFLARPDAPAALAASLWDLDAWASRARSLCDRLETAPTADTLAEGFVLSAAVLRHLQGDPLLPVALLPADWPGAELRSVYDRWDARYRSLLADWHRAWATRDR